MSKLSSKYRKDFESDPELVEILEVFDKIDSVYSETLVAMGIRNQAKSEIRNTSEVKIDLSSDNSNTSLI